MARSALQDKPAARRTVPTAPYLLSMCTELSAAGTVIHLVDDLVYAGETLCAAVDALRRVDLTCGSDSAILWTRRANASTVGLEACGLRQVTCLVSQAGMSG